jgi:hypothetical protein
MYCINTSGMFAFFYNNISSEMKYEKVSKVTDSNFLINKLKQNVIDSTTKINKICKIKFSEKIEIFFERLKKFESRKKILKNNLYITICLFHYFLMKSEPEEEINFEIYLSLIKKFLVSMNLEFIFNSSEFQTIYR